MNAWMVMITTRRKYWGSPEYADDPTEHYSYDSFVQNYKQVSIGDLLIVRHGQVIVGVARVDSIRAAAGVKTLRRCPDCGISYVRKRKTLSPVWRCDNGHEFDEPDESDRPVVQCRAEYRNSYIALEKEIHWKPLDPFFHTASTQSIRSVWLDKLLNSDNVDLKPLVQAIAKLMGVEDPVPDFAAPGQRKYTWADRDTINRPSPAGSAWKNLSREQLAQGRKSFRELKNFLDGCRSQDDNRPERNNLQALPLDHKSFRQLQVEVDIAVALSDAPQVDVQRFAPLASLAERCRERFMLDLSGSAAKSIGVMAGPAAFTVVAKLTGLLDEVLEFLKLIM